MCSKNLINKPTAYGSLVKCKSGYAHENSHKLYIRSILIYIQSEQNKSNLHVLHLLFFFFFIHIKTNKKANYLISLCLCMQCMDETQCILKAECIRCYITNPNQTFITSAYRRAPTIGCQNRAQLQ